jgi:hypothetical protein
MTTYDRFIFESYDYDPASRTISLRYSLDSAIHFTESFQLPAYIKLAPDHPDLDQALFALHLSGGASYYKTYCPRTIEVRSGHLSATQAEFWNTWYTHGLGEFFYRNQIDYRGLIKFPVTAETTPPAGAVRRALPKRALVPFGGGKDSVVTTELLRAAGVDQTLFRLRAHPLITSLAHTADLPLVEVERQLDPKLFELNAAGAYNGHVPITGHISFLTIIVALLAGYDSVFFSNERSSSYGNVDYLGMMVNHQWSKSLAAEQAIRSYIENHVTGSVRYLNLVRPLSELHIAKLFSHHPQYLAHATSCNRNWVLTQRSADAPRWCGECPKCAFSYALLSAYLDDDQLQAVFGANLYAKAELIPLYRELWGSEGFKPFECVGTPEETQAASWLALQLDPSRSAEPVMQHFKRHVLPGIKHPERLVEEAMTPHLSTSPGVITQLLEAGGAL